MNKSKKLISLVFVAVVASGAIWTISPYFTNSIIDEALPTAGAEPPMMKEEMTSNSGKFVGVGDGIHDAQGDAMILTLEDGSRHLRFENFKSTDGSPACVKSQTAEKLIERGWTKGIVREPQQNN